MQNLQKLQFSQDSFQNLMLGFLLHFVIKKREHIYMGQYLTNSNTSQVSWMKRALGLQYR